eukprot:scaffold3768_cov376-Prasinococcus_capsulatus_cf.AAC.33
MWASSQVKPVHGITGNRGDPPPEPGPSANRRPLRWLPRRCPFVTPRELERRVNMSLRRIYRQAQSPGESGPREC